MDRSRARLASWAIAAALLLRALTCLPPVIDDDEAWFALTGYSMQGPRDALRAVIDNKPPGTAWYYWLLSRWTESAHLAQWARLGQCLLLGLSAWWLARILLLLRDPASRPAKTPRTPALLFLLALGAPGPKLFAVTNEGLMIPAIVLALWLAWPGRKSGTGSGRRLARAAASGVCMAAVVLLKQTGFLFLLPWLLALEGNAPRIAALLGFAPALAAGILCAGPALLWQLAYVYPASVLSSARAQLFGGWSDLLSNLLLLSVALLPLLLPLPRALAAAWANRRDRAERALLAWVGAAGASILIGKGLFPHYFLLILPPLCLLACRQEAVRSWTTRSWSWLSAAYAASALIAAGAADTGVFWGNDLAYFGRVSDRIRSLLPAQSRVFVWGGSPLPLALSGSHSLTGFPSARFAMPPYATPELQKLFLSRFEAERPDLVLDLHDRGDNQFNLPPEQLPPVAASLARDYESWADPALPWAYFHLRKGVSSRLAPSRLGLCRMRATVASPAARPLERSLERLAELRARAFGSFRAAGRIAREWPSWDRALRESFAQEWKERACEEYGRDGLPKPRDRTTPFAIDSRLWWASLAVVEMQPVYLPRGPTCAGDGPAACRR